MLSRPLLLLCAASLAASPALPAAEPPPQTEPSSPQAETDTPERERLLNAVGYLLSLSEAEMLKIIPKESRGIFWTTCPHCRKRSRVALWKWEPQHPGEITCEDCHTRFPNSDYPDETFEEVKALGGPIRFHYFAGQKGKGVPGKRYFLRAAADFRAKAYMAARADDFGQLYRLTGDTQYAGRAFAILKEFARVFPRYPYIYDGEWHGKETAFYPSTGEPLPENLRRMHQPCRWAFWGYMDLPQDLLRAFQNLAAWPGLQTEEGRKEAQAVKENLFAPQVDYVLGFPDDFKGNMSITAKWPDLILAARLLNRPEILRKIGGQLAIFQQQTFLYDGAWWETSPAYASQIARAGASKLPTAIEGTPTATVSGDAPEELRALEGHVSSLTARFDTVMRSLEQTRLPNGRLVPINDTWARSTLQPREETRPVLWPGLGIAILGGGRSTAQWHSYLNFTSGRSHKHADALSIGLTIGDKELLSDIGYTHSRYQPWTQSTHAHNTVVVDGRNSANDEAHTGNRLLHFFASGNGFQLASARSQSAYPGTASRYERTLLLIGHDASDAFLVDLFTVAGGSQHDYLLHGSADEDSTATMENLNLTPYDGTLMASGATFTPPTSERASIRAKRDNFGYVSAIRHAPSPGGALELRMALKGSPQTGTRTFLATEKGDAIFLAQAPSVRRTISGHLKEDEAKLDQYHAPFFSWRRTGDNLRSTFAAVHQPLASTRPVHNIAKHDLAGKGVLLRIDYGEGETAYIAQADTVAPLHVETADGPLTLEGSLALLRLKEGRVVEARLVGGKTLALGAYSLQGGGTRQGTVRESTPAGAGGPPSFVLEGDIVPNIPYDSLLLAFPDGTERAYTVERLEPLDGGQTRVFTRENAGFEIRDGKIAVTSYPQREMLAGPIRYRLATVTSDFPAHANSDTPQ